MVKLFGTKKTFYINQRTDRVKGKFPTRCSFSQRGVKVLCLKGEQILVPQCFHKEMGSPLRVGFAVADNLPLGPLR